MYVCVCIYNVSSNVHTHTHTHTYIHLDPPPTSSFPLHLLYFYLYFLTFLNIVFYLLTFTPFIFIFSFTSSLFTPKNPLSFCYILHLSSLPSFSYPRLSSLNLSLLFPSLPSLHASPGFRFPFKIQSGNLTHLPSPAYPSPIRQCSDR